MSTAVARREVDADLVRRTVANGATDDELRMYLYDCQRRGVHPLDKLLHFTKRGGKYTPVTSIDLMRSRAADSGELAGSDDAVFKEDENGKLLSASVTVYRITQGSRFPYTGTARFSEYNAGGNMWSKMPHTMLAKCAEALALRKAFPQELAGLYSSEEMDQVGPVEIKRNPHVTRPEEIIEVVAEDDPDRVPDGDVTLIKSEQRKLYESLQAIMRTIKDPEELKRWSKEELPNKMALLSKDWREYLRADYKDCLAVLRGKATEGAGALDASPPSEGVGGKPAPSTPFDPEQWLKDLEGAYSGCEDAASFAEADKVYREGIMQAMDEATRTAAKAIRQQHFDRITADG